MADPKKAAIAAAWIASQLGSTEWNELCERLVEEAYGTRGRFLTAKDAGNALNPQKNVTPEPGWLVLFSADETNSGAGHAGIYQGNGTFVGAQGGRVSEVKDFLKNPYWASRFRGYAPPPEEWQGRAATPELEKGAQALIAQATGAPTVADNELVTTYTEQRDEIQERLNQNRAKLEAAKLVDAWVGASDIRTPEWVKQRGTTEAALDQALALLGTNRKKAEADGGPPTGLRPKDLESQVTKDTTALQGVEAKLATAKQTATTAANKPPTNVSTNTTEPYIVRQDAQGGLSFSPNPNYQPKSTTPASRRTQVVGSNLIDLESGELIARLPAEAKSRRTQVVGSMLIDLDNGDVIADLTEALAKPEKPAQPTDVNAPTTTPNLVRRAPDGSLLTEPNPNYQKPEAKPPTFQNFGDPQSTYQGAVAQAKALAQQKSDELKRRVEAQEITLDQARSEFGTWWQTSVEGPLAGYRSAAESANAGLQFQNETAQRAEDQRVEGINRQRQTMGLEAGTAMREKAAALIPGVRSASFMDKYAQGINAFANPGGPAPQFTAQDFRPDPGQIPDLARMAEMESARVLAAISPAAAAKIGRPVPQLPTGPALNDFIPQYAPTA